MCLRHGVIYDVCECEGSTEAQDHSPLVSLVWKVSVTLRHPQSKPRSQGPGLDLLVLHGEYSKMSAKLFFAV